MRDSQKQTNDDIVNLAEEHEKMIENLVDDIDTKDEIQKRITSILDRLQKHE